MHLRCLSPPPQTACQNTERRHITAKARSGAAGKVLNVKINLSETSVKPGGEAYGWLSMAEESLNLILVLYSGGDYGSVSISFDDRHSVLCRRLQGCLSCR